MLKKQIKPKSNTFVRRNIIKEDIKSTNFGKYMLNTINTTYKPGTKIY